MDWKQLIADLKRRGMTQAEIGKRVNAAQNTISDIANGRIPDPRYSIGARLRSLHESVMSDGGLPVADEPGETAHG